jgi:hypothetical protein
MKTAILLLSLFACGPEQSISVLPAPPAAATLVPAKPALVHLPVRCSVACVAGVEAADGTPVNCAQTAFNVALLVRKLAETGIASSQAEACAALTPVTIQITPEAGAVGEYVQSRAMIVGQDQVSLGHETLHAWEDFLGILDWKNPHAGWSSNMKYDAFATQFAALRQR